LEEFVIDTPVEIVKEGVHVCKGCEMASDLELRGGLLMVTGGKTVLSHCTFRDYGFREFESVKFGSDYNG
jgi:hypothetical protein